MITNSSICRSFWREVLKYRGDEPKAGHRKPILTPLFASRVDMWMTAIDVAAAEASFDDPDLMERHGSVFAWSPSKRSTMKLDDGTLLDLDRPAINRMRLARLRRKEQF
jgi:hypothetical protein